METILLKSSNCKTIFVGSQRPVSAKKVYLGGHILKSLRSSFSLFSVRKKQLMASREGPTVAGTDGSDFRHRERVAPQYQLSVRSKPRLKSCLFFHIVLFLVMLAKLSADILDRLDIFVLEIEEAEVPKPLVWEYAWCCSLVFVFYGLSSLRRNNTRSMQIFVTGNIVFGIAPVLFALGYYLSDVWTYISTRSSEGIMLWQGYPYALLWYAFLVVALQVHLFSLYFAHNLISAWKSKGTKKIN